MASYFSTFFFFFKVIVLTFCSNVQKYDEQLARLNDVL